MTRIETSTVIAKTPEEVFAYVATPENWPLWHPSSLAVSPGADHPLQVGEQVTEQFLVAGRRGQVVWTVTACEPPRLWTIEGRIEGGGGGAISYRLVPEAGGTRFARTFSYFLPNPLLALLDRLVLRRRVRIESMEAVNRLKTVLESGEPIMTKPDYVI